MKVMAILGIMIVMVAVLGALSVSANDEVEESMETVVVHEITGTLAEKGSDQWLHTPVNLQEGIEKPISRSFDDDRNVVVPNGYRLGEPRHMDYGTGTIKEINGMDRKVLNTTTYPLIQEAVVIYEVVGTFDEESERWLHTPVIMQAGEENPIGRSFDEQLHIVVPKGYTLGEPSVQSYGEPMIKEIDNVKRKIVLEKGYPLIKE